MRIALCLEYCGSGFEGWQTQPHGRTVQDALEPALAAIAGEPVATVCAGRTDTGVHASTQVVHFDTTANRPLSAWVRGVNTHLPAGVVVTWAQEVAEDFHARFSALSRRYRYVLLNRPMRSALLHGRVGWHHAALDVEAMHAACAFLPGIHDFSAFRAAQCQAASPVRDLRVAQVERRGEWILFDFEANAFLHHMIRNLVGALVDIGKGGHSPGWIQELLAMRDRRLAPPTFSPDGLYLAGVHYPDRWNLPDQGRIIAPLFLPGEG
ncbi:MAG: tRNA pseudouridine(38-40) synthase TruA [Candidatus Dactylopiibacterium carminicum]|nr:MAG: tRNA pseudouridine(38-40) synthase TruA [Candidatus Dactylopiibacterium carminicum]